MAILTFSTSMLCDLSMSQKSANTDLDDHTNIWFYLHTVVGCNLSYENFGEETEPATVYWTGSASSLTECRELCSSDINCAGCGYNYDSDQCTKSNSTSVKSSNKDESHFYKKKCDSGTLGPTPPVIYLKQKRRVYFQFYRPGNENLKLQNVPYSNFQRRLLLIF